MQGIVLYTKKECTLCDEVRALLDLFSVEVTEIDIESDPELHEKYFLEIPVVRIKEEELDYRSIDYFELQKRLQ
ncbi:glutaredoxin family protein [Halobacillus litoralis]|uniref:Glutaredoxin family protein n=1 Tax=Halobacillus litoralis TaxID=45668 RepID=A0A845DTS7_9BACI|nr:glutaredoxin family protein [Halobacillus litoralis]MCA1021345.1 glutaredoxin family protein [Halobacillus litoralis]MYL21033.1 glutaredoxin family protein [Halobacillus litoralis]MYL31428.1 glutaredoxin family protein [Halobacillus halophilus]MYL38417.1 glutaredoxin family protein [Halobacillus litoralis]